MTPLQAHLLCLALVFADLIARSFRIQWLLRGLGYTIGFREAFTINTFGDAACALTPMRIAGEPARLAGMLRARVPATAAFVAISMEVLAAWPVIVLSALFLTWRFAPEWWQHVGPHLARVGAGAWPWILAVLALSIAAWWSVRRWARPMVRAYSRPLARVLVYWRRMPVWPLVASLPLTLINVVARTALLPVLALTLPHPPPIGPMAFGSFALLYSQLVLPTPAGVGAVDLGVLAGVAGDMGSSGGSLLLAWRFYSVGVGALVGVWLAARIYGWRALRGLIRKGAQGTGSGGGT